MKKLMTNKQRYNTTVEFEGCNDREVSVSSNAQILKK